MHAGNTANKPANKTHTHGHAHVAQPCLNDTACAALWPSPRKKSKRDETHTRDSRVAAAAFAAGAAARLQVLGSAIRCAATIAEVTSTALIYTYTNSMPPRRRCLCTLAGPHCRLTLSHSPGHNTKMSKPAGVHASRAARATTPSARDSTQSRQHQQLGIRHADVCTIHAADEGPTHSTTHVHYYDQHQTKQALKHLGHQCVRRARIAQHAMATATATRAQHQPQQRCASAPPLLGKLARGEASTQSWRAMDTTPVLSKAAGWALRGPQDMRGEHAHD